MADALPEQEVLFRALAGRPDEIDRFFGVRGCAVSPEDYLSLRNLRRLIGLRGFLAIARAKLRRGVVTPAADEPPAEARAAVSAP